jgi:hypothetical protein
LLKRAALQERSEASGKCAPAGLRRGLESVALGEAEARSRFFAALRMTGGTGREDCLTSAAPIVVGRFKNLLPAPLTVAALARAVVLIG